MIATAEQRSVDVNLREVGLRDGLQLVSRWPTTAQKLEWLRLERLAGVSSFEIGSFLPPNRYPQFADIRELLRSCAADGAGFEFTALALNERGVDDALATGVSELQLVVSATESHSQANAKRSRDQAIELVAYASERREEASQPMRIMAAISMAFGCSIEGNVALPKVLRIAERCLKAGADRLSFADTVGFAGPLQVAKLCREAEALALLGETTIHLHDTRGMAIANASAALECGIGILDGSLGGLGGCPFAPGATGNVVMEDLAFLCESMGLRTGTDLAALLESRRFVEACMTGESFHGGLAKAGLPSRNKLAAA